MNPPDDERYTAAETARRRDEVVRQMANTPPQPRVKALTRHPRKKRKAGGDRAAGKNRAGRER